MALPTVASAARGHVFKTTFGTPCTVEPCAPGTLKEPAGLAVNESSGDLYVVDKGNSRVERFSSAGAYLGRFDGSGEFEVEGTIESGEAAPTGKFEFPEAIAVDNDSASPSFGDVYVTDVGHSVVDKFSPTGAYLGQISSGAEANPLGELGGVAVSPAGTVWIYQLSGEIDGYENGSANEFLSSRVSQASGFPEPGFAVDPEGDFYVVASFAHTVAKLAGDGHVLTAEVPFQSSLAASGLATEAASGDVYIDHGAGVERYDAAASPLETLSAEALTQGSGVAVDSSAQTVYVADSAAGLIAVFAPRPPSKPSIESEAVLGVTSTSARLEAEVNPRSEVGEGPTEYSFEYGLCASLASCAASPYESTVPLPPGTIPADFAIHAVSAYLEGLQPASAYHLRLLAQNQLGTVDGEEKNFTTQTAGSLSLPDARQWEQVSPTDMHGAKIEAIGIGRITQAAAGGGAISYAVTSPTEAEPQGNSNLVQVLSARAPSGWQSRDIASPHDAATSISVAQSQEYRFFSPDLSRAALNPVGAFTPSLSPQASEQTAYLRTDFPAADPTAFCAQSCYRPLVTAAPGYENVPEGTSFGGYRGSEPDQVRRRLF
ncbi:MAG: hypothetical protein H0X42_13800 [Solirubrobacterales bacterium]|nr:hypothetical protein [Solirubrobacterales bacterium]